MTTTFVTREIRCICNKFPTATQIILNLYKIRHHTLAVEVTLVGMYLLLQKPSVAGTEKNHLPSCCI